MNQAPRSWAAGIVSLALAVLAACLALSFAADLLREALPVLVPAAVVVVLMGGTWRWLRNRNQHW